MKRGFTLVELLAVIVILAVIALITIPAVMKMIDNATINSYRRSIDLYGKAVSQGIISYESDMVEKNKPINITFENIDSYIEYEGNDVDCKDKTIYSDRTILLTECTVQDELVYAEEGRGYGEENYYYYTNSRRKMKLIKYIEAAEEELEGKSINGTCTIGEDKITCNGQDIKIRSKLENAIEGNLVIENSKIKSYSNLKFETEKKIIKQEEIPQVIDEQNTVNDVSNTNETNDIDNNDNTNETIASEDIDYRGYYADVDGDGIVDGVIYADLAFSRSGEWGNAYGLYSYSKKSNLNEYTISNNTYKKNEGFGENKIIKLKSSKSNKRFYVMALEDFSIGSLEDNMYYWYYNADGKMDVIPTLTSMDFGMGYSNTGNMISKWNKNGIGEGSYLGAIQDDHDIFKYIQTKYEQGWYIVSMGEWGAFANYLTTKHQNSLTTNNYNTDYQLSDEYWTSSQRNSRAAWTVSLQRGDGTFSLVTATRNIRLSTTF